MVISAAARAAIKAARIIKANRAARIVKTTKARRTVKKPVSWSTKKRELQVSAPGDPHKLAKYQAILRANKANGVKLSKAEKQILKIKNPRGGLAPDAVYQFHGDGTYTKKIRGSMHLFGRTQKGIHGKGAAASDSMSDSDLKRNLVGTPKDGLYHTGLETSKSPPKKLEDMAGRYDTLGGWLRKDKKEYLGVPPPKGNLQDKEFLRLSRQSFTKKDRLRRDLSWDPSLRAHLNWQGPTRPGALFQGTPKRKADPFDKIARKFEVYNPAVFNAELGVSFKKGFHGNWMTRIEYDKLKPRKLAVKKSGDALETTAGIAAAGAWTGIAYGHVPKKKAKPKDQKPGRR